MNLFSSLAVAGFSFLGIGVTWWYTWQVTKARGEAADEQRRRHQGRYFY